MKNNNSKIAVPLIKKSGWYEKHPMKSYIKRLYDDIEEVYLWLGPGKCMVDLSDLAYLKFLDKYGIDHNAWEWMRSDRTGVGKGRVCFSFIEEVMIGKYTNDESLSERSRTDLYRVLHDVLNDYVFPRPTVEETTRHYKQRIKEALRENNGKRVVLYTNGEVFDIVEYWTKQAFTMPLYNYFWATSKRRGEYND